MKIKLVLTHLTVAITSIALTLAITFVVYINIDINNNERDVNNNEGDVNNNEGDVNNNKGVVNNNNRNTFTNEGIIGNYGNFNVGFSDNSTSVEEDVDNFPINPNIICFNCRESINDD